MSLDFNQLRELLAAIAQTDIAELTLKSTDFELTVRKGIPIMPGSHTIATQAQKAPSDLVAGPTAGAISPPTPEIVMKPVVVASPAAPPTVEPKWEEIKSPMVGTFYRAAGPDEAAFVEVGDRIQNGQAVCIIEAMKLMNEIEAEDVFGQVMEILVQNGEPVEYGQTLMRVNPG